MDLTAIMLEVRTRTGYSASDTDLTDTILTSLVNSAIRQITLEADWPWLETFASDNTAAATEIITLNTDVRKVTSMQYEYRNLLYRPFRDRNLYYGLTGVPAAFSVQAGSYYIWPTPDAVYSIDYGYVVTAETALSTGTDTPLIPDWASSLIITKTAMLCARRRRDHDLERVFYAEYQNVVRQVKANVVQVTLGLRPHRVGNRGGLS
jgi:hypothetical protein